MISFHDVIGVGFGPANLALAIALKESISSLDVLFLETQDQSHWHPHAMFHGSDIQNHPLRDLVTPRNPRSQYTFINFLKEHGRLFEFLNLGITFPLRTEYAQYLLWVADHFAGAVRYNERVTSIQPVFASGGNHQGYHVVTNRGQYFGRGVVLAPGRSPFMPEVLAAMNDARVVHFTRILQVLERLDEAGAPPARVAVVGGSQSAVEVTLELRTRYPRAQIYNVLRTFGFRQKDLSPFTGEVYFPEYCDLYFDTDGPRKQELDEDLRFTNYSSADHDVLDALYLQLYEDKILERNKGAIYNLCDIESADAVPSGIALRLKDRFRSRTSCLEVDLVVAATGFRDLGRRGNQERLPELLRGMESHLQLDHHGCIVVERNYDVRTRDTLSRSCPLVLNGLCETSHGMGDAGSFSLLALRSERILSVLTDSISQQPIAIHPTPSAPRGEIVEDRHDAR